MKFGNTLILNQIPSWSEYYIDYNSLKLILKQIAILNDFSKEKQEQEENESLNNSTRINEKRENKEKSNNNNNEIEEKLKSLLHDPNLPLLNVTGQYEYFASQLRDEIVKTNNFYSQVKKKLTVDYLNLINSLDKVGIHHINHTRKNSWSHPNSNAFFSTMTSTKSYLPLSFPIPLPTLQSPLSSIQSQSQSQSPSSNASSNLEEENIKNLYLLTIDLEEFFSINQMGFSKILKKAEKLLCNQPAKKKIISPLRNELELNFPIHELHELEGLARDLEILYKKRHFNAYATKASTSPNGNSFPFSSSLKQFHRERLFFGKFYSSSPSPSSFFSSTRESRKGNDEIMDKEAMMNDQGIEISHSFFNSHPNPHSHSHKIKSKSEMEKELKRKIYQKREIKKQERSNGEIGKLLKIKEIDNQSDIDNELEIGEMEMAASRMERLSIQGKNNFLFKNYGNIKKIIGFAIATSSLIAIIWIDPMKNETRTNCLAILIFASILWSTETIPLYVTSMLIPLLIIVLQVLVDPSDGHRLSASESATIIFHSMFSQVIMLMLGGFSIAAALGKYGISKAIAEKIIFKSQKNSHTLLLSVLFLSAFSSMWISNVAAPALCFSLLESLLNLLSANDPMGKRLILSVAFGSNIGGMLSPISSPQNIIAIERILSANFEPSWLEWFAISLPIGILSIFLCWIVLSITITGPCQVPLNFKMENSGFKLFDRKRIFVILVALATVVLWCEGNKIKLILGQMGTVALIPLIAYFGTGILDKDDFNGFFWNIIMLAMGGLALGEAIYNSGLLMTIGKMIEKTFYNYGLYTQLLISTLIVLACSTFISHTVSALIFLPLIQAIGESIGHTRMFIMCGAFACSIGMALPISGFPNINAIAQEDSTGKPFLTSWDFMKSGLLVSFLIFVLIISVGFGLMYILKY